MQEHHGKQATLVESVTFLLDELRDQIIHDKTVKIKWKTELIGLSQIEYHRYYTLKMPMG